MAPYNTPGVYVEEISTFPPSVAEVSTAIPAFIGYTEKSSATENEPQIARINTMLEFESIFGEAQPSQYKVTASKDEGTGVWNVDDITQTPDSGFILYYALSMYFKNGGGSCYIVSVGSYSDSITYAQLKIGLNALEKEDEPTLIVSSDATYGLGEVEHRSLCEDMLAQCGKLRDRFAILDVQSSSDNSDPIGEFREISMANLMYGAAYYPHLQTALTYHYVDEGVTVNTGADNEPDNGNATWEGVFGDDGILIKFVGSEDSEPKVQTTAGTASDAVGFEITDDALKVQSVAGKTGAEVVTAWETFSQANSVGGFAITISGDGSGEVEPTGARIDDLALSPDGDGDSADGNTMDEIKLTDTALYNLLKTQLNAQRIILPPSSAIAGIYARVDRNRGVWKSPANEGVSGIIAPSHKITNEEQGRLNIHPDGGKSINAIRAFTGKGTLVWGARTLDGNSNEWRYISVRRLFNMIEESSQKATAFAVFEPNDATTWLKVKAMIESFLFSLWERGALAGPTPEAAYFVNVGLGKTMTPQDILEGRMNVEIGIAAVRPAEFIILKFSHKLQEA